MEFDFDAIEEEDSPFPEVRASVSNIDDPEMPCLTLRMWFIGLLLIMVTGYVTSPALYISYSPEILLQPHLTPIRQLYYHYCTLLPVTF